MGCWGGGGGAGGGAGGGGGGREGGTREGGEKRASGRGKRRLVKGGRLLEQEKQSKREKVNEGPPRGREGGNRAQASAIQAK